MPNDHTSLRYGFATALAHVIKTTSDVAHLRTCFMQDQR